MREQVGCIVAEPAQVHDLRYTGALCFLRDRLGRSTVYVAKVGCAERMDEVVDDVDAVEHVPHRGRIRRVRRGGADVGSFLCVTAS
jgi:hypothetical protein